MLKNIEIYCANTDTTCSFPMGTTLLEISKAMQINLKEPILGAYVNNRVKPLDFELVKPKHIRFFDYSNRDGQRLYLRTLSFVLFAAVKNIWPDATLKIDHAISKGYYCEIDGLEKPLTEEDIWLIKEEMQTIVNQDIPIERKTVQASRLSKRSATKG